MGSVTTAPAVVSTEQLRSEALGRVRGYVDPVSGGRRENALLTHLDAVAARTREAYANYEHAIEFADTFDEILQAQLAAIDSDRYARAAEQIGIDLRALVDRTRNVRPTFGADDVAPALAFLDEQLRTLMAEVREQEPALAGIHDARSALRGGGEAQDAWAVIEAAVDRYAALRAAQRHLVVNLLGTDGAQYRIEVLNRTGHLRNPLDHERAFQHRRTTHSARELSLGEAALVEWIQAAPRPPFNRTGNDVLPVDPIAYLRWIADGNKAWIPGVDEMIRVDELADRILNRAGSPAQRTAARDAYYARDGVTKEPGVKREI
ncbi:hypothetical protein ACTJI8_02860 [Microbacterium sp. 22303]|uniref:hypothetical protein n=1 Tax=Microbacterium sp. 22303 TaxID=3453905 RepID=UPI003F87060D